MRRTTPAAAAVAALAALASCACAATVGEPVSEPGLAGRQDILYFRGFDDEQATRRWFGKGAGYGWTGAKQNFFFGKGALEVQQTTGTHLPMEIHDWIDDTDVAYVRWYRKWEAGYDFTQHKMPGVYAHAGRKDAGGGAGIKPNGLDKFSCKLFVDFQGFPHFYTYHPDQKGIYGDEPGVNVGAKTKMEPGRWYCFEMMIKSNTPGQKDGELKMWLDGQLVAQYAGYRFRDAAELKINQFTYSAYVGGDWSSKRDQKLWDDQLVVARSYIGPIKLEAPKPEARPSAEATVIQPPVSAGEARAAAAEREAGKLLQMARQAEQASQRDVAAALYRQIVEKYPATEAAKTAAGKLK